jgi:beta-glucosidase
MIDAVVPVRIPIAAPGPTQRVGHSRPFTRLVLLAGLAAAPLPCVAAGPAGVAHPADWPKLEAAVPADPKIEAFVEQLVRAMTLEEKVGQLVQADIASVTPQDLRTYKLGSILAGGNAAPGGDVRVPASRWLDLTDAFFRASVADPAPGHAPIPVLFGIDAVHGHARIPGATIFPHNVGLGAAHDPALVERIGQATAEEVAATGIDWTFAPTVAVVRDPRWGRSYESYSEDPALVAAYARAMVTGLQGRLGTADFMAPGHTLASVKHFLGDGGTLDGRDQFDDRAPEALLRDVHGAAYPAALASGALIVMASYNGWQGAKLHANHSLLTGVLKERWAFPGFVVGDWNAQEEIPGCTKYSCPEVLAAGLDMYMAPDSWKRLYQNILEQTRSGQVEMSRVDDAVRRILRVKALAGLFAKAPPKARAETGDPSVIGSSAHRAIAREAVRESLVLLKNDGHVLPLDPHAHILVAGAGADDIGMQCGGWTIDWQGDHNRNADFPGGTSIYAGIKAAVERAGGKAVLSPDGTFAERPAAAIVVFGETPYAEFEGDRETLEFVPAHSGHLALLRRLRAAGIPVISVFLSGRPLWTNRELNASTAFVAAWLPGTEGAGIADLLFAAPAGSSGRDFTGRLGFSWPATAMPVIHRADGVTRGALFPRGFGLSLADRGTLAQLPEHARVAPGRGTSDSLYSAGHVTAPWSIYVADAVAEVRLTMDSQASPAGAVTAIAAAPGVRGVWSGGATAEFRIGGRAADDSAYAADGTEIVARIRVDEQPTGPVRVGIRCDAPYGTRAPDGALPPVEWKLCGTRDGALLDVTAALVAGHAGTWQTLHIPLACIARLGASLANVSSLFTIETAGRFAVTLRDVRVAHTAADVTCSTPRP